jgi:hypothetical protein
VKFSKKVPNREDLDALIYRGTMLFCCCVAPETTINPGTKAATPPAGTANIEKS